MFSDYRPTIKVTLSQANPGTDAALAAEAQQWFEDAERVADQLLSAMAKCSTGLSAGDALVEILACLLVRSWHMDTEPKIKGMQRNPQGVFAASLNLSKNRLDLIGQHASAAHRPEESKCS